MRLPFKTVTIVGVGLIGGSLGLATRRAFPGVTVTGFDRRRTALRRARRMGAIDRAAPDLPSAVSAADLVVLATPIRDILSCLSRLGRWLPPGAVVTDTGSTKAAVLEAARALPPSVSFIGGHPMTGKAVSGVAQSEPDLFQGAPYVLCPVVSAAGALPRLRRWVRALGARPMVLDADEHDRLVAYVSHLPQLLSTALAGLIARPPQDVSPEAAVRLSAGGFRDMIRLASSPYDVWGDILATNQPAVRRALREYVRVLRDLEMALAGPDLKAAFARANRCYQLYTQIKGGRR